MISTTPPLETSAVQSRDVASREPMHFCLVSAEYPPETAHGGIGSQTFLKGRGLAALGHRVHVISRSIDEKTHVYDDGPIRVTRIPGMDHRFPIHATEVDWLTYSAEVAATIAELHKNDPFDLIDFPEWGCEGYVHLLNRSKWEMVPTVVHLHGPLVMFANAIGWPELDSEFYRAGTAMEGACLRLADRVYSSSRCSAEWCARHYGIPVERVPVLHMGVDTSVFRPRDVQRDSTPTIVFVGKLSDNKGAPMLVEAAGRLVAEFPGLKVKLIGNCKHQHRVRINAIAAAAGAKDLVEFAGFVHHRDLPDHLCRAHVFAAPSSYEGGPGFVYLEAMACGLPVIGCSGSGAAEVISHGVNGMLVAPHDRDALLAALRRLLANTDLREEMGRAALQYVRDNADTRICANHLEKFYASVVAECASAAGKENRSE